VRYPATTPPPATDFDYITALPESDFVYVLGPDARGLSLPESRVTAPVGTFRPQRVRFIYVGRGAP
jgi:hypothetical protein